MGITGRWKWWCEGIVWMRAGSCWTLVNSSNSPGIFAELDHHYLNDLPFFQNQNPSSENIARYIFERLAERINTDHLWVQRVATWESSNACATYFGEKQA